VTSYKNAGVDLEVAEQLVERIGWRVTSTWTDDVVGEFGGFAAGIRIPPGYTSPVLVMTTDGVGTKAELARVTGLLDGIGSDLVAMVVDDLAAAGAQALAMTDYIAVGHIDLDLIERLIESITDACNEADVALIGGETAEHPGVMDNERFDLSATALGVVEQDEVVDGSAIVPGDVVIGVHSRNLRSNGFSLVRALVVDQLDLDDEFPGEDRTVAEVLLEPSVVYAPSVLNALYRAEAHGLAHITGGGLPGNVIRILPEGTRAILEASRWEVPPVFTLIQRLGSVSPPEMFRTFNMGIGFVVVAAEGDVDRLVKGFESYEHQASVIGRIIDGDRGVEIR
jgi:phosphoribosylformylglycinamidine cyclo-ligase